jgi:gliding motility-associated-like protein
MDYLPKNSKSVNVTSIPKEFLSDSVLTCDPFSIRPEIDVSQFNLTWDNSSNLSDRFVEESGFYSLTIEQNNCIASDSTWVQINNCECTVYIPEVFTPNGDDLNDHFKPVSDCDISDISLSLFSRWGELIAKDIQSWDGTYQNSNSQQGVYLWILTYKDRKGKQQHKKGTVNLMR